MIDEIKELLKYMEQGIEIAKKDGFNSAHFKIENYYKNIKYKIKEILEERKFAVETEFYEDDYFGFYVKFGEQ